MITSTERKLQTYLYPLIIITPNTKCDCGFCHIFRQKLVRSLFGQIVRRPIIRPHFFGAYFFWNPFVRGPFVSVPICPRTHLSWYSFVPRPICPGPVCPGPICPGPICSGAHLSGTHLSGAHLSRGPFVRKPLQRLFDINCDKCQFLENFTVHHKKLQCSCDVENRIIF